MEAMNKIREKVMVEKPESGARQIGEVVLMIAAAIRMMTSRSWNRSSPQTSIMRQWALINALRPCGRMPGGTSRAAFGAVCVTASIRPIR